LSKPYSLNIFIKGLGGLLSSKGHAQTKVLGSIPSKRKRQRPRQRQTWGGTEEKGGEDRREKQRKKSRRVVAKSFGDWGKQEMSKAYNPSAIRISS
jgi:hypothetical protein